MKRCDCLSIVIVLSCCAFKYSIASVVLLRLHVGMRAIAIEFEAVPPSLALMWKLSDTAHISCCDSSPTAPDQDGLSFKGVLGDRIWAVYSKRAI